MMKKYLIGLILLLNLLPLPTAVYAQSPVTPQVISTVSQPGADSLGLEVYFVITDSEGRPVLEPNLEEATIQVVGSASEPIPASVGDPASTLYVALLLDVSGSMQNVIGQVRSAAMEALKTLPANARVSVIAFSDKISVINEFTGDFNEVQNRLQQVRAVPNGPTCLYDAVWDVIDRLDQAAARPQDRRALILFTDGRDERGNGQACSVHTLLDAVQKAQRQPATPLHTIGLCTANCANINGSELREMAGATSAFAAIGGQTELDDLFQTIMDGLNAQLVARAQVYPRAGLGQAVLAVRPRDLNLFATTMFNFQSDRSYAEPLPPVTVRINQLDFQPAAASYLLQVAVGNPQSADRLILGVEETEGGKTVVKNLEINLNQRDLLQTDLPAGNLLPGRKYTIKIQAVDANDQFLTRPAEVQGCSDDPTVLGCKEFTHEPPVAPGCEFAVQSVESDYSRQVFHFDLVMPAQCDDVFYQGVIVERESGQKLQDIARSTFFAAAGTNRLTLPMPARLLQLNKKEAVPELALDLTLETREGKQTAVAYEFIPARRPPTPMSETLRNNVPVLVGILACIAAYLIYRMLQAQKAQKAKDELKRPPVNRTEVQESKKPTMRLRLRVLASPDSQVAREVIIEKFPFVLGRSEGDLLFKGDKRISGKHARITISSNEFFIEDLGSTNYTYLAGKPLKPQTPHRLLGKLSVRLGPDTELEVETL